MDATGRRRVVIGVGNPDRGDDAAGRAVAQRLRDAVPGDVAVVEEDGEATALIALFDGAVEAYLIDACASGTAPGTVRRFDVGDTALPHGAFGASTHGFGMAEAIELARALGQLPPRCIVYAIEGASFGTGAPLSPLVSRAVADVAARLRAEIVGDLAMEEGSHA